MPALATITIDVLSAKSGVGVDTIRVYQRQGLLPKPRRVANNLLLYRTEDVERLIFIRRATALGFSAEAVREMLGLATRKPKACSDVYEIASRHLMDIRRRMVELARMERALAPLVQSCPRRAKIDACPILSSLSHPEARSDRSDRQESPIQAALRTWRQLAAVSWAVRRAVPKGANLRRAAA